MVPVPNFERRVTRGTVGASVVGKFHKGDEFRPVVYLIIAEDAEILTPVSRRSGSPVITCVSNGLTGGKGSRFIDGELGMF